MNNQLDAAKENLNKANFGEHEMANIMFAISNLIDVVEAQQERIEVLENRLEVKIIRDARFEFEGV